jgi:predicted transcriptional regulator
MAILTFRVDDKLDGELRRLAQGEGRTRTEVIREAIAEYSARKRREKRTVSVAEAMKEYIGAGSGSARDLSVETGKKFREILIGKKKARRL